MSFLIGNRLGGRDGGDGAFLPYTFAVRQLFSFVLYVVFRGCLWGGENAAFAAAALFLVANKCWTPSSQIRAKIFSFSSPRSDCLLPRPPHLIKLQIVSFLALLFPFFVRDPSSSSSSFTKRAHFSPPPLEHRPFKKKGGSMGLEKMWGSLCVRRKLVSRLLPA